ncbi:Bug family tripartite tricarboxylate transporter substrate binding protein [Teichococcus oryzae]|uniref:Bug family tripartite tricarboxylate transporter substrate binding protein n=1 Tax=Teichococcus oryzae TaxID=1608942 RepID=UPI001F4FC884|nr:tripartite tricarboxylate transporter substrate binding protein [Pseudoroseomonas oryzae]
MEHGSCASSRRMLLAAALGTAGGALARPTLAQPWPGRPLRIVVGYAPGGLTDLVARMIGPSLTEVLGQPVVVENRTGAAGNLATEYVVRAPADGSTFLASSGGQITVSPHTYTNLRVDPVTELEHITMIGEGDQIICTNNALPTKNFSDFVALAKRQPGRMSYATSGSGGNLHLFLEFMRLETGIEIEAIHYRGGAALLPDLMSNQVQLSLSTYPVVESAIREGQVRPLLIIGRHREKRLPEVPTATEVGYPALDRCANWFGLHAPKGTSGAVLNRMQQVVGEALRQPAVIQRLAVLGLDPVGNTPDQFLARIRMESELYGTVARRANLQVY